MTTTSLADAHTAQPDLKGRSAVITGGTTGIGRAVAVLLASSGVNVFICGRERDPLDDALARIREVGNGDGVNVDLSDTAQLSSFFEKAEAFLGKIDIAVINAAVSAEALADTAEEEMRYQIATDFTAYLASAKHAVSRMKSGADLIFIGSMSAVSRSKGSSIYVAAKSGIEGFAKALREELAEREIKVGLIEPGLTGADMQYSDYSAEEQARLINEEKMLRAEDIAVAVHFMLSQPRRTAVSLMRVEPRLKHS